MNHFKQKRIYKGIATVLSFTMLMTLAFPQKLSADACIKAFKRCMIDAAIATSVNTTTYETGFL
jgi:dihydroorotase